MMFEEGDYYSFSCIDSSMLSSKKKKMMNKKRFSDEQVRSLESIFQNETKLEPKKKVQLARELGLQPRQVAIWFQNKRARYKSKQLERDYAILRANYNALASKFDSLKKEKQSLLLQVQKLRDVADEKQGYKDEEEGGAGKNNKEVGNSESGNYGNESDEREMNHRKKLKGGHDDDQSDNEAKPSELSMEAGSMLSDDDGSSENNNKYLEKDETDILNMVDPVAADSLTATKPTWMDDLRPDGLFDQAVESSQWWDFWS